MPAGGDPRESDEGVNSSVSFRQRLLLALPRVKHPHEKPPLGERLRDAMLKPAPPESTTKNRSQERLSVEDLAHDAKVANDKERLVGLIAAPLAAAIGVLVINALIANDPSEFLKSGKVNKLHVSVSIYHELTLVLLGLAVLMLATAWFRKRLYLGMVMALYGLAIFNLHYWGFGIPFIMGAAWLLVRSYRLQREFREATADAPERGSKARGRPAANSGGPPRSKRYTPPVSTAKRSSPTKPTGQRKAV